MVLIINTLKENERYLSVINHNIAGKKCVSHV